MRLRIFYHDRCFDGAASAAVFSRLYRERINPDVEFIYTGLAHRASQLFDENQFDGDENAIVDFKYCMSPRLTWWFDHHQSAFLTPADGDHFRNDRSGKKFYDPSFRSCTKFVATIGKEKFGFDPSSLSELIHWADIVDGALFPDAEAAVMMREPALQLTMVMEADSTGAFTRSIIPKMTQRSLQELADEPEVKDRFQVLYQQHLRSIDFIRENGKTDKGVVFFDLTGPGVDAYNKFVPYYLFPDCVYSVSVCPSNFRTKISVGSNPWKSAAAFHNLATICERYGGGGHPRVGAVSLEPGALDKAVKIAHEIVAELQSDPPKTD